MGHILFWYHKVVQRCGQDYTNLALSLQAKDPNLGTISFVANTHIGDATRVESWVQSILRLQQHVMKRVRECGLESNRFGRDLLDTVAVR